MPSISAVRSTRSRTRRLLDLVQLEPEADVLGDASCAGRARSSGRPSRCSRSIGWIVVDHAAADQDLARRSAPRGRRSAGGPSSCPSPKGRRARRTRRRSISRSSAVDRHGAAREDLRHLPLARSPPSSFPSDCRAIRSRYQSALRFGARCGRRSRRRRSRNAGSSRAPTRSCRAATRRSSRARRRRLATARSTASTWLAQVRDALADPRSTSPPSSSVVERGAVLGDHERHVAVVALRAGAGARSATTARPASPSPSAAPSRSTSLELERPVGVGSDGRGPAGRS